MAASVDRSQNERQNWIELDGETENTGSMESIDRNIRDGMDLDRSKGLRAARE